MSLPALLCQVIVGLAATAVVVASAVIVAAAVSFADAVNDDSSNEKCPEDIVFTAHR